MFTLNNTGLPTQSHYSLLPASATQKPTYSAIPSNQISQGRRPRTVAEPAVFAGAGTTADGEAHGAPRAPQPRREREDPAAHQRDAIRAPSSDAEFNKKPRDGVSIPARRGSGREGARGGGLRLRRAPEEPRVRAGEEDRRRGLHLRRLRGEGREAVLPRARPPRGGGRRGFGLDRKRRGIRGRPSRLVGREAGPVFSGPAELGLHSEWAVFDCFLFSGMCRPKLLRAFQRVWAYPWDHSPFLQNRRN